MSSNVDYGLILKALAGAALVKGASSAIKARDLRNYTQTMNHALPSGYQVNYDPGMFYGGDVNKQKEALKMLYEQQLKQREADAYAQRTGSPTGIPGDFSKNVYTSEYAPVVVEGNKQIVQGMAGARDAKNLPALMHYFQQLQQGPPQYSQPPAMVQQPGMPPMQNAGPYQGPVPDMQSAGPYTGGQPMEQPRPLVTGAQQMQYPELPPGFMMSPETLRSTMGYMNTQDGHNIQRDRLNFDRQKYQETDKPYKEAQLKKIQEELKWLGPKAQAYIHSAYMNFGRAPSKIEVLQGLRANGEITDQQFKDAVMDQTPGKGRGQEDVSPDERRKLATLEKRARNNMQSKDPVKRAQARKDLDYVRARTGGAMGDDGGLVAQPAGQPGASGGGRTGGLYGFSW